MEIQDLLNKTAEVIAEYNGFTLKMQVFTEKLTPEYKAKMMLLASQAQAASPENADSAKDENAQMLADLIESWRDGLDEPVLLRGEDFPPDYENLMKLSFPMIARLTTEITKYLGELANPTSATA